MNNTMNSFARTTHRGTGLKARIAAALVLAGLLFSVSVAPASAQGMSRVKMSIPFAFVAGKKALPAGEYTIERSQLNLLTVRRSDGSATAILATTPADATSPISRTELIFNRYGDQYFLSQVRPSANTLIYRVPRSPVEERLAKSSSGPEVVAVAANRAE
jgi:hypothetical protein